MKYKAGDIVTIRSDLEKCAQYGEWVAIDYMVNYRGTQQVIDRVYNDYYLLDGLQCKWTDEMFEDEIDIKIDLTQFI